MDPARWYRPMKLLAWVVLALLLGSFVYAGAMAIEHWSGIGV